MFYLPGGPHFLGFVSYGYPIGRPRRYSTSGMAIYPLQLGGSKDFKQIIWQHDLIQFETVEPPPAHFSTRGYNPKDYLSL